MSNPLPAEPWYTNVIKLMLEEHLNFLEAATHFGQYLQPEDVTNHQRRSAFKELHSRLSKEYYENKASPAQSSKDRLIGEMRDITQRLLAQDRLKEAADVIAQTAKLKGIVGPDTTLTILQQLTGEDFEKVRKTITKKKELIQ